MTVANVGDMKQRAEDININAAAGKRAIGTVGKESEDRQLRILLSLFHDH